MTLADATTYVYVELCIFFLLEVPETKITDHLEEDTCSLKDDIVREL